MDSQTSSFQKRKVTAVILAGDRDFGRCPLASHLPTALWLIAGRTALERLLANLADHGIEKAVICCGRDKSLIAESARTDNRIDIQYLGEPLPVGTAGCIREAARQDGDASLFLLLSSSLVHPPDVDVLIDEHINCKSDMTVVLEPDCTGDREATVKASGIYICGTSVLEFIPEDGYCDIKEGLIPTMLRAGKHVRAFELSDKPGDFRDCHEYLQAVSDNLEMIARQNNLNQPEADDRLTLWAGSQTRIHPGTRISGNVVLMDGVEISEGSVIIGPTLLERNVTVGKNSVIINSILWNDTTVKDGCIIERCVADSNSFLPAHTKSARQCVVPTQKKLFDALGRIILGNAKNKFSTMPHVAAPANRIFSERARVKMRQTTKFIAPAIIMIAFIWSYWHSLNDLWNIWMRSDEYSSGLLVPFLAVYVLWLRRGEISKLPIKPSVLGLFLFIVAQAFRIFGLFFLFSSAEMISIVLSVAAVVLLLFGRRVFMKVSTVLLFLFLMLPWPHRMQAAISLPLQSVSTSSAVFCLEVMGFNVTREGNLIHIGNSTVAVAEACNGLRMITAFFVITALVALLINRTWWEKLIVLVSSLPVAFLCNTLRLAITAIFFTIIEGPYWEKVFHDFGGYAMMPLALAFIVAELWFIDKLTVPPEEKKEVVIVRHKR